MIGLRDYAFIYNGTARSASAKVTGVGGADLGDATIAYSLNGLPAVSPTEAGEYVVTATWDGNANYAAATATGILVIGTEVAANRTAPTIDLVSDTVPYTGQSYVIIAEAVAPDGANLGLVDVSYSQNGVPVDVPTEVGTYTITARFEDNYFYLGATATATLTITKVTPTIVLDDLAPFYDGTAKAATVTTSPGAPVADAAVTWAGGSQPTAPGT